MGVAVAEGLVEAAVVVGPAPCAPSTQIRVSECTIKTTRNGVTDSTETANIEMQ